MPDAALAALLERLTHHDLARQLTARYAAAIDTRDYDALGAVFAEDAVLEIPGLKVEGRAAIVEWYRDYMTSAMPGWAGRHFIVNHRFSDAVDGRLPMQTYFFYTFRGTVESIIGWGRYNHTVVFGPDGAAFSSTSITVDHPSDVSEGWAL
jgi:3-phenylpropionate/cinnamic acid dioxygenase small subunit